MEEDWTSVYVDQTVAVKPERDDTPPTTATASASATTTTTDNQTDGDPTAEPTTEPEIDDLRIRRRLDRLQASCLVALLYIAPILFVIMVAIVGTQNWRPEYSLLVHAFETVVTCAGGTLSACAMIWFAMANAVRAHRRHIEKLLDESVRVRIDDVQVQVWGSEIVRMLFGRGVHVMWISLLKHAALRLPNAWVSFRFELNGKSVRSAERFFADEVPALDATGQAWALVDPKRRHIHCVLREKGELSTTV